MALGAHMYPYSYIYYASHRDGVLQQELKNDNIFGFVLSTSIPRFKFLHVCSIFPIIVSIFERLVLNA